MTLSTIPLQVLAYYVMPYLDLESAYNLTRVATYYAPLFDSFAGSMLQRRKRDANRLSQLLCERRQSLGSQIMAALEEKKPFPPIYSTNWAASMTQLLIGTFREIHEHERAVIPGISPIDPDRSLIWFRTHTSKPPLRLIISKNT